MVSPPSEEAVQYELRLSISESIALSEVRSFNIRSVVQGPSPTPGRSRLGKEGRACSAPSRFAKIGLWSTAARNEKRLIALLMNITAPIEYSDSTCRRILVGLKTWGRERHCRVMPKYYGLIRCTVRMIEMPRFFFIRKYDWFISPKTSQLQIRSKSF